MKKMKTKFFVIIGFLTILLSCNESTNNQTDSNLPDGNHKVVIEEVLQAETYSYLSVKERSEKHWIAVVKDEYKVGDTYYYVEGLQMDKWESKDLGRTFEKVLLVNIISDSPIEQDNGEETDAEVAKHHSNKTVVANDRINIEPIEGGVTLGELFTDKKKYGDKTVKVKGIVVKFNAEIMGKNWVHIQDGTKNDTEFDLTVTTTEQCNVGDTIVMEGKISLDKDFGSGYFYKLIMEDAKQIK